VTIPTIGGPMAPNTERHMISCASICRSYAKCGSGVPPERIVVIPRAPYVAQGETCIPRTTCEVTMVRHTNGMGNQSRWRTSHGTTVFTGYVP
jgi:hypothetical protein